MSRHICWFLMLTTVVWGQAANQTRKLAQVGAPTATSEPAGIYDPLIRCDDSGNVYLHTEQGKLWAVRKLDPNGKLSALYDPSKNESNLQIQYAPGFWIQPNGDLYQIAYPRGTQGQWYVFVFNANGNYKSKIPLHVKWLFYPTAIAVYPSGNMLIAGASHDPAVNGKVPFTGLFSPAGKLLKMLNPEGDKYDYTSHQAVSSSMMEGASDGNIYVMRWDYPATVYAIADGGTVVKTFTIDAGDPAKLPANMHITGNRLAVQFFGRGKDQPMKIVDLDGKELATYLNSNLGGAFACYTPNPDRFLFFSTDDEHKLVLNRAQVE